MPDILYTLFIFSLEKIIELIYIFAFRVSRNPAISVLGVSLAVSVLTLPLYFMAEKHQQLERDIQKKMKSAVDNIRAVFKGDERFMLLSTYYRQNGYHPLYSLRSSISLIIQIPFFIAAYQFIANLEAIKWISFGPISDLARPDSIIKMQNFSINVLPVLMTLINVVSAFIYTKGLLFKDKVQLYGMAALFLILLYNSPSGLVLYWTGNNLFSLIKNILQKIKHPKIIIFILLAISCISLDIYLIFFHRGLLEKRILVAIIAALMPVLPFISKKIS